jgi:transposase
MSAIPPKAEVNSERLRHRPVRVDGAARAVIQAPKPEPRIMRYELSDYEWTAIKPMLPNKPRGVRRVNDRRVLNGIFWILRSGAPWRDLPGSLFASREHGRTFRRNEIAKTRSASARICIAHATWLNGSSTRTTNVCVLRPDTTNSQPTIWCSSNSHQSEFGYALMSPCPSCRSTPRSRQCVALHPNPASLMFRSCPLYMGHPLGLKT